MIVTVKFRTTWPGLERVKSHTFEDQINFI